ncbi:MAG: hypothetical protein GY711_20875 [bacterium]|nr:hypothetical protein [bacterium]
MKIVIGALAALVVTLVRGSLEQDPVDVHVERDSVLAAETLRFPSEVLGKE